MWMTGQADDVILLYEGDALLRQIHLYDSAVRKGGISKVAIKT